jgi:hypothetical protein
MNWKTLLAGLVGSLGAFCVVVGVADIYAPAGGSSSPALSALRCRAPA